MSRGIKEGNHPLLCFNVISANMLRNAACLSTGNLSFTNVIQQGGLAMVNVSHDRNNRRTRRKRALLASHGFFELILKLIFANQPNPMTQLLNDEGRCVLINHLVDRGHNTQPHQFFNDHASLHSHLLRELSHRNVVGDINVVNNLFCRLGKPVFSVFFVTFFTSPTAATPCTALSGFNVTH